MANKCPKGQVWWPAKKKCTPHTPYTGIDTQTRADKLKPMLADVKKRRKKLNTKGV